MSKIDFSVVIPTWNRSALVVELLKSLYEDRQIYKYGETEVLIIDSSVGEEKNTIVSACEKYDAVYIEGVDSVRKKRNMGIDSARYDYICFIDSDVVLKPGLLNEHAEQWLENNASGKMGGTFGLTEFVGDKGFWWKVLEQTTFIDSFGFAKKMEYVSWTLGNNATFKKSILLDIGKFEENLPFKLGGDDLDMSYRVTKEGYFIKTVPEAVTYHSTETWNNKKAVFDRSKRWGTMEYYTLKRHPELVNRRFPMAGDIMMFLLAALGVVALVKQSLIPLAIFGVTALTSMLSIYFFNFKGKKKPNIFYWMIAMAIQGKYRLHRLIAGLKNKDLSLAFKGQFFGIWHIRSSYQTEAKKFWIYMYNIIFAIVLLLVYGIVK